MVYSRRRRLIKRLRKFQKPGANYKHPNFNQMLPLRRYKRWYDTAKHGASALAGVSTYQLRAILSSIMGAPAGSQSRSGTLGSLPYPKKYGGKRERLDITNPFTTDYENVYRWKDVHLKSGYKQKKYMKKLKQTLTSGKIYLRKSKPGKKGLYRRF